MRPPTAAPVIATLVTIGRCIGCDRPRARVLDDGVCRDCLRPPRGRRWALASHRVRTDPAFALEVYLAIASDAGRRLFETMYGIPHGADVRGRDD